MDTNKREDEDTKKKGYQSQPGDKADFKTGEQAASSSEEKGIDDLEHGSSKSNDDVRLGTSDVKSREGQSDRESEEESELSSREGPFGEGIPPKPEGDQGYGRQSGQSGAI